MLSAVATRKNGLAWLPAIIVAIVAVMTIAGVSMMPTANGATQNATVTVTASIGAVTSIDTTSLCTGTDFAVGAINPNSAAVMFPGDCSVTGTTNDPLGVTIAVDDARVVNTGPAFCITASPCPAASAASLNDSAAGAALADDVFGIAVLSATGGTAPTVTAGHTANPTPTVAGAWYPIPDAAQTFCDNASAGTLTCNFRFGYDTELAATAGNYTALVRFTATDK